MSHRPSPSRRTSRTAAAGERERLDGALAEQRTSLSVIGFTVGIQKWSEEERKTKVKALKIKTSQQIARIALQPKVKKTDLGKIVLEN